MIVWNHGEKPIFIVTDYEIDPAGGPGHPKSTICIAPGNGIDLDILELKPEKPAPLEYDE